MFRLFYLTIKRLLGLIASTLIPPRGAHGRLRPKRLLVMAVFLPVLALVLAIHWAGLLLDELLFPGYRKVRVGEPLFVLGIPRSGTTHLHRVLASDSQFTTFKTWECLFAVSVTARLFWLALARVDRAVGGPFARLLEWFERKAFGGLEGVHAVRLDDPEEDYFSLVPILRCFILVLPFPDARFIWDMAYFDRDVSEPERRAILDYYELCLKKHLYVFGRDKRMLSKNAAFAPLAGSLSERFTDARFVVCVREPAATLPSQLSSIQSGVDLFGVDPRGETIRDRFVAQLTYYYENLHSAIAPLPAERRVFVEMSALKDRLAVTVQCIYETLGLRLEPAFEEALREKAAASRSYRSTHRYTLEQFGLTSAEISEQFAPVYATLKAETIDGFCEDPVPPGGGEPEQAERQDREPTCSC